MPRRPRLALAGFPHHVVQRGNDRQAIFRDDVDRRHYLNVMRELAGELQVAINAYVLMPNHVHLLLTPAVDGKALSRLMQGLGRRYVRRFNDRHGRTGSLWEGRFFSSLIEADRYLFACYRYIELNPVRAGLVTAPEEFQWSSHRHHIGLSLDPIVSDHSLFWGLGNTPFDRQRAYQALFEPLQPQMEFDAIRVSIRRNQALVSKDFSEAIPLQREQLPSFRTRGRPRKI
jgi:putative transposase